MIDFYRLVTSWFKQPTGKNTFEILHQHLHFFHILGAKFQKGSDAPFTLSPSIWRSPGFFGRVGLYVCAGCNSLPEGILLCVYNAKSKCISHKIHLKGYWILFFPKAQACRFPLWPGTGSFSEKSIPESFETWCRV